MSNTSRYHTNQFYQPYTELQDRYRPGEPLPCRLCLQGFHDHYNGCCPISDNDEQQEDLPHE